MYQNSCCWSHPYSSHYLGLHPSYRKWGSYHWKIDYPKLDQHELGCTSYEPTNPGYTSECSSFLGLHFAFGGNEFRVPVSKLMPEFQELQNHQHQFPWSIFASHQLKIYILLLVLNDFPWPKMIRFHPYYLVIQPDLSPPEASRWDPSWQRTAEQCPRTCTSGPFFAGPLDDRWGFNQHFLVIS